MPRTNFINIYIYSRCVIIVSPPIQKILCDYAPLSTSLRSDTGITKKTSPIISARPFVCNVSSRLRRASNFGLSYI